MKILHVIDSAGIYGAEIMLLNLMSEQIRLGIQPILLGIESEFAVSPSDIVREAVIRGMQVIRMGMKTGYNKNDGNRIVSCATENNIDLIHSHGYKSDILLGFMQKSSRKIPIISTVHGWISVRMLTRIWVYNYLDKLALRRLDAIVYVNPKAKNVVKHKYPFYIENGIPEYDFSRKNNVDPFLIKQVSSQFIVGVISRLSEEKGIIYLLQAVRMLLENKYDIKLVIIGDGRLRTEYERFITINQLEQHIKILGYKEEAYLYLPYFDVFVLPSLTEGLPITVLEAMQASVPIIATDVGAVSFVLENGKYGTLVKPGDSILLANAIKENINSHQQSLIVAEQARKHALEKYSSMQMAVKYTEIYNKVISHEYC